jgi:hypothetical protein
MVACIHASILFWRRVVLILSSNGECFEEVNSGSETIKLWLGDGTGQI